LIYNELVEATELHMVRTLVNYNKKNENTSFTVV
jgi:hypothetical protein